MLGNFEINDYILTDYSVNVDDATNYLVGLYYKTGLKYYCDIGKINKLLTIFQLWCLKNNKNGIINSELKFNKNFFNLTPNMKLVGYSSITTGSVVEDNQVITAEFDEKVVIPELFSVDKNNIPPEVEDILIKIFRIFGNCTVERFYLESKYILDQLNGLTEIPTSVTSHILNNELSYIWNLEQNSTIIKFINNYIPIKTNNNSKAILHSRKFFADFEYWFKLLTFEEQCSCLDVLNKFYDKSLLTKKRSKQKTKRKEQK